MTCFSASINKGHPGLSRNIHGYKKGLSWIKGHLQIYQTVSGSKARVGDGAAKLIQKNIFTGYSLSGYLFMIERYGDIGDDPTFICIIHCEYVVFAEFGVFKL